MHHFNGRLGALLFAAWLLAALLSTFYTPYDPLAMQLEARLSPPSTAHWMGTDQYGRDLLSRVLSASGVSFAISATTVSLALLLGAPIGAFAAFRGGYLDKVILSLTEALLAFPPLLMVLLVLSITGPSKLAVIVALALAFMPTVLRVTRSSVLTLREQQFIEASRIAGASSSFMLFRHLLPNCLSPLSVLVTSIFAMVLLVESALSFLGLGVPPPEATWGALLADSRQYLGRAPWLSVFPGAVITLAVMGVNLLGDALRDVVDPRLAGATGVTR